MFGSLLSRLQSTTLGRPKSVLAGCLLLVALAAWLGSRVEFRTSRSELAPAGDPDQQRWEALLRDYRGSEPVIACVEVARGQTRPAHQLERFADLLADEVARDPLVDQVFHKFDADWLLLRGLYLLPPDALASATEALEAEREFLTQLASSADLAELNRRIAGKLRQGSAGTEVPAEAPTAVTMLQTFLGAQRAFLERPRSSVERWAAQPPLVTLSGEAGRRLANGYIKSHDAKTAFLLISPRSTDDSLAARRELLTSLRDHVSAVSKIEPGFSVAFTGTAAMTVEEMDTIRRDTWRTSIVAVLGVSLLTLLVFRWKTHALLVLAALAVGVTWSFGAAQLELGYLNLITSAFISTLVGVGVAYGIHPVSEYELEGAHTGNPVEAVRESYRRTGPAIAAAGFTTSVAFFSILLMRFRGFAELGLVAGVGVLLCLLSATVCLPAMLVLYGKWRNARDRQRREGTVALDRLWLERMAGNICRFPRATVLVSLALTGFLAWTATGLGFNTNILDLLPQNAESLRYQRRVALESDLSPVFNFVVGENLDELRAMRARANGEPSIERFESALRFLPSDPQASRRLIRQWSGWLDQLRLPTATRPLDRSALADSLRLLEQVLADSSEAAFAAGFGDLAGPLEHARQEAEDCLRIVSSAGDEAVAAWNAGQRELRVWLGQALDVLRRAARVDPPSLGNMPAELKERFFTRSGRALGFLFPTGSVFEPEELDAYVAASLRVSPEAIGFPFMFHKMSNRITTGFYRAVGVGALLVFLILLIDLRNLGHALLAAAPLAVGLIWALGGMRLLGLSFNFANLVAVPLVVGVGIDNGVHVIHRVRLEGREGMHVVLRHTGRAILISSLTTMIGFGSLALASHRGLASLGLLLLLGVGSCLVASTVLLPNLMVVLGVCPAQRMNAGAGQATADDMQ